MLFPFYIFRKKCLCHCKNNGLIQNTIRRSVCAFFVFCFTNIGFRIYALQYPMHLWLWIDVRFDGLAVVFCCGHEHWHWMWFMLSRGGCARGASLSIDKIMMLPIFLFNLFLYIISVALQCVSLTLSVDQPLSSLLENLCFFLLRAHLLAVLFVWQFLSRNWCANDITHCICYTYIYIGRCHVRVRLVFFYFFFGICCDWIRTTRANHIICLIISENFVTLSCGRPFIWCEIRLGSVSVCVCWTWITSIVDNNVNIHNTKGSSSIGVHRCGSFLGN